MSSPAATARAGTSQPRRARAEGQASIRVERKHPLAIRWMHWVNFPVLFTMIWSGILIYWNDSDNAYLHPHRVYRVGLGRFTLVRFFPDWFYKLLHVPYHVTTGLSYHLFFMWIFALNGVAWVLYTWLSGEWRMILPERRSLLDAIQVTLVDLHLRKGLPRQTKYNGRAAYRIYILRAHGSDDAAHRPGHLQADAAALAHFAAGRL